MTLQDHMSRMASSCFYQLRRIKSSRRSLPPSPAVQLVNSFIISRVDYCNSILADESNQLYAGNAQLYSTTHTVAPGTTKSQISSETSCTGYQFNIVSVSSVQCLCTERYTASLLHTSPDSVSNNPSSSVATSSDPRLLLNTT